MTSNIYTKKGDKGETSLLDSEKVKKNHPRLELYGTLDELNSWLGLIHSILEEKKILVQERELLLLIQKNLFTLGSLLACPKKQWPLFKLEQISTELTELLEKRIDKIEDVVGALQNFILPGGALASSYTHVARTRCRYFERKLSDFSFSDPDEIPERSLEFINRLSDYLFSLARLINETEGKNEQLWKKEN